jgi:hypothetical protein
MVVDVVLVSGLTALDRLATSRLSPLWWVKSDWNDWSASKSCVSPFWKLALPVWVPVPPGRSECVGRLAASCIRTAGTVPPCSIGVDSVAPQLFGCRLDFLVVSSGLWHRRPSNQTLERRSPRRPSYLWVQFHACSINRSLSLISFIEIFVLTGFCLAQHTSAKP